MLRSTWKLPANEGRSSHVFARASACPQELRLDLRAVLQRCRPDWDISSAEHRTAWAKVRASTQAIGVTASVP